VASYATGNARHIPVDFDHTKEVIQISKVEDFLLNLPAEMIAARAVTCGSYARAIFHWEQRMKQTGDDSHLSDMQTVYEKIDEPDGIEGISSLIDYVDINQQIFEYKRNGRWEVALSFYETSVKTSPTETASQLGLLSSLKASGQYSKLRVKYSTRVLTFLDSLVNSVAGLLAADPKCASTVLPFAAEAAWRTLRLQDFERLLEKEQPLRSHEFNVGVARALFALGNCDNVKVLDILAELRHSVMISFSPSTTSSLTNARSHLVRLHAIHEIDIITKSFGGGFDIHELSEALSERLDVLGSLTEDKQYILGIRRAALTLTTLFANTVGL